jgi:hypothetical protein
LLLEPDKNPKESGLIPSSVYRSVGVSTLDFGGERSIFTNSENVKKCEKEFNKLGKQQEH